MTSAPCHVVDSIFCQAPPSGGGRVNTSCFACGEITCASCACMVEWHTYGRQRVCHDCLRQEDQYDARVYVHLWTLAGYRAEQGRAAAERDRAGGRSITQ